MNLALAALALTLAPMLQTGERSSDDPPSAVPEAFLGTWRAENGNVLALEPGRATWKRGAHLAFYRAHCESPPADEETRLVLESWAHETQLTLTREDDQLRVGFAEGAESPVVYHLAPEAAAAVALQPVEVAPTRPIAPERVEAIQLELRERAVHDQELRQGDSAQDPETPQRMRAASERDALYVRELLTEVGWIDAARFGERAADDAFLLVQHSTHDLPLMVTVLPYLERGVAAGEVEGQLFALMHDRLELSLGRSQRYGSQLGTAPDGTLVLMPLEDPAAVHRLRAELGMQPLADYLGFFGGPDAVRLPPGLVFPELPSPPASEAEPAHDDR